MEKASVGFMCGIAGSLSHSKADVAAMVAAMKHRGPDDSGIFEFDGGAIGMTRLAIVDVSPAGHQPMIWANGAVALVFNGEIYNHIELRNDLVRRGCTFRSRSDTEVILQLYLQYGIEMLDKLRGMFAIAIYDQRPEQAPGTLFLARDHFGIKPLVYANDPEGFVFASEIKALVASGVVVPRLSANALRQLLSRGSVCQPDTILEGVKMLMPGHLAQIVNGQMMIKPFWQPGPNHNFRLSAASYEEQRRFIARELYRAVEQQLVADVPVGAFLSGGLDSSLLVALMSRQQPSPILTFSVGFDGVGSDLDETSDAQVIAETLGTRHRRVVVDDSRVLDLVGEFARAIGQPSVDGFNSFLVSKAAAEKVKVAISGTGADELFAGYPWFRFMSEWDKQLSSRLSERIERCLQKVPARFYGAAGWLQNQFGAGFLGTFAAQYRHFNNVQVADLLGTDPLEQSWIDTVNLQRSDVFPNAGAVTRVSGLCLYGYTLNQLLRDIDAVSMSHSLEVRIPFLDLDLVEAALSLPTNSKLAPIDSSLQTGSYRSDGIKRILVDIASDLLPPPVFDRPKRGFSIPMDRWLKGCLRSMLHDTVNVLPATLDAFIDPKACRSVVDRFERGLCHWGQPWILLVLGLWIKDLQRGSTVGPSSKRVMTYVSAG
jgi:asparagine synthase (glutamine-hydrolysing)